MFDTSAARRLLIGGTATACVTWAVALYVIVGMPWHEFVLECFSGEVAIRWPLRLTTLAGATALLVCLHFAVAGHATCAALAAVASGGVSASLVSIAAAFGFRYQHWSILVALSPPTRLVDRFLHGGYADIVGDHWFLQSNARLTEWHLETYGPVYLPVFLLGLLPISALGRWLVRPDGAPN